MAEVLKVANDVPRAAVISRIEGALFASGIAPLPADETAFSQADQYNHAAQKLHDLAITYVNDSAFDNINQRENGFISSAAEEVYSVNRYWATPCRELRRALSVVFKIMYSTYRRYK